MWPDLCALRKYQRWADDDGNRIKAHDYLEKRDGYTAIFSYHEIFNNPTGDKILVLFEENGMPIDKDGAFVLISATDKITGARHVKWLKTIEVKKI